MAFSRPLATKAAKIEGNQGPFARHNRDTIAAKIESSSITRHNGSTKAIKIKLKSRLFCYAH